MSLTALRSLRSTLSDTGDNGSYFVNELITEFLALVGTEHVLTVVYSKEENAMVKRANKKVIRHIRHVCLDRRTKSNWRKTLPIAQRIINSHYSARTGISPADIMFGKSLDLDSGIFSKIPEDEMYAKGSLSTHMAELLKTQSDMIVRHKQIIQKGDINHTSESSLSFLSRASVLAYTLVLANASMCVVQTLAIRNLPEHIAVRDINSTYESQNPAVIRIQICLSGEYFR